MSCFSPLPRWSVSSSSTSSTGYCSRSVSPSSRCWPASPGRTTRSSASCPAWPACTTSTTIPQARTTPGLVVYRYDSPLFFANAEDFHRRALAAVDAQPDPVAWFILNTEANVEVDITALDAVDELRRELDGRGIVFGLARVKHDLLDDLDAYGLTASIGSARIFPTLPTAKAAYEEWRRQH